MSVLEMAGVRGRGPLSPKYLIVKERDGDLAFPSHADDICLSPEEARRFARQILRLAKRLEDRTK